MAENEGVGETGEAIVMCLLPDVCWTNGVPVHAIIAHFDAVERQVPNVRFRGNRVMTTESRVTTVIGDEAGKGGGIVSGVNLGYCRPITHSSTVRAKGSHVIYHTSFYWMNCNGPEGPGNTLGKVFYVKDARAVFVGPLGNLLGDTNPPVKLETQEEESRWSQAGRQVTEFAQSFKQGAIDDVKSLSSDLVGMVRFGTDVSVLGLAGDDLRDAGWNVPAGVPSFDRGADNLVKGTVATAKTVGTAAGVGADLLLGDMGDRAREAGATVPAWVPSQQRGVQEIEDAAEKAFGPSRELWAQGHYGQVLGTGAEKVVKVVAELAIAKGLGRAMEGMTAAKTVKTIEEGGAVVEEGETVVKEAGTVDGVQVSKKPLHITSAPKKIPCFTSGTPVLTPLGPVPIERVRVGAIVMSFDAPRRRITHGSVSGVLENSANLLTEVVTDQGLVRATTRHRFWVDDRDAWIAASELEEGMLLCTSGGATCRVRSVSTKVVAEEKTYNLSIDGCHTYFVGDGDGVLVHNESEPPTGKIYVGYDKDGNPIYVGQTKQSIAARQRQHQVEGRKSPDKYGWKSDMRIEEVPGMNGLTDAEMDYHERRIYDDLLEQGYKLKNRQIPLTDEKVLSLKKEYC